MSSLWRGANKQDIQYEESLTDVSVGRELGMTDFGGGDALSHLVLEHVGISQVNDWGDGGEKNVLVRRPNVWDNL